MEKRFLVKAWLAPSVGCRVQRGWAPREPLVGARDADMVMVRGYFGLWASGQWHSYHGTRWYKVQEIQGREERVGQRPAGLLIPQQAHLHVAPKNIKSGSAVGSEQEASEASGGYSASGSLFVLSAA